MPADTENVAKDEFKRMNLTGLLMKQLTVGY